MSQQEEEVYLTERTGNVRTSQQSPSQSTKKTSFTGDTKQAETTPLRKKKQYGVVETSGKKIHQVSSAAASAIKSNAKTLAKSVNLGNIAKSYDEKKVGMGGIAKKGIHEEDQIGIEEHEAVVRKIVQSCWVTQFLTTLLSSVLVFVVYLISIETIMSCALTVGLTLFWYYKRDENDSWEGSGMDWIVLGFAVITPLTVTIKLAFTRRERALYEISRIRSFCFQLYTAHTIWDWPGRDEKISKQELLKHSDKVLEQLIGIGDELSRFLTLPTSSRSYHRMLKGGRVKAATIMEVAYRLMDSLYTQRMLKISKFNEDLKTKGLSATECSRLRQSERFIGEAIENLRHIKMYRTPQALRAFGRIFTLALPAFYAPAFAQLAIDLHSLANGIFFAILTPLVLTALFQTMQVMEDPFVGWVSLDGIDVREEMEILHFQQLISARKTLFPNAPDYAPESKAAIVSNAQIDMGASARVSRLSIPPAGSAASTSASPKQEFSNNASFRVSHFHMESRRDLATDVKPSHRRNQSNF